MTMSRGRKYTDLTGQQFGEWKVLKNKGRVTIGDYPQRYVPKTPKGILSQKENPLTRIYARVYLCKCSCGKRQDVISYNLISGDSTRCSRCSAISQQKPFEELSRERKRQLRRLRDGLCKRSCEGVVFKSGYCEKHYEEFREWQNNYYKNRKIKTLYTKTFMDSDTYKKFLKG